ncbi:MAG: hypothetical protein K6G27_10625 [Lachnospiraceae bacterium]|nr:hypothetical protein [Lachnospiraceae bacterium]
MQPISAVYTRMDDLLSGLGEIAGKINKEVSLLQDKLKNLGISWEGAAYDEYSRALLGDFLIMQMTAANIQVMYTLLYKALSVYQQTEMEVMGTIGGMR